MVKGIWILGTNRSTIRPADDVTAWAGVGGRDGD
jgi:hypothetical protein